MKNAGVENNKLLYYDVDNKIWRCIMSYLFWKQLNQFGGIK